MSTQGQGPPPKQSVFNPSGNISMHVYSQAPYDLQTPNPQVKSKNHQETGQATDGAPPPSNPISSKSQETETMTATNDGESIPRKKLTPLP